MGEVHRCTGRGRANLLNTLNPDDVCLGGRSGRACPAGASWCHSTTRPRQQQRPDRSSRSVHAFTVGAGPASLALAPTSQPLVARAGRRPAVEWRGRRRTAPCRAGRTHVVRRLRASSGRPRPSVVPRGCQLDDGCHPGRTTPTPPPPLRPTLPGPGASPAGLTRTASCCATRTRPKASRTSCRRLSVCCTDSIH